MATIVERNNSFYVVYNIKDENGKTRQKWETYHSSEDAQTRKMTIEFEQATNTFIPSSTDTLKQFLDLFCEIYGRNNWSIQTYEANIGLINNHIIPDLGNEKLSNLSPMQLEIFFNRLSLKRQIGSRFKNVPEHEIPLLSQSTIKKIYVLLNEALRKAVSWEMISKNPLTFRVDSGKANVRPSWDTETLQEALKDMENNTEHPILRLMVHTAFICSGRSGEINALTWDSIDFKNDTIFINKIIQRCKKSSLEKLRKDKIFLVFPEKYPGKCKKSVTILKSPKTETSIRTIFMTQQLKQELLERKEQVERAKNILGDDYHDYNLVFCLDNGDPITPNLCLRWFKKWQKSMDDKYPEVVFHSLRSTSTTYKLVISNGDIKTVQGDTGHAQAKMVTDVYSRIWNKPRQQLAQKVENEFYQALEKTQQDNSTQGKEELKELLENDSVKKLLEAALSLVQ